MRWSLLLLCGLSLLTEASTVPLSGQFRVDEQGAATYQLPLALPKARANVAPNVVITYSSSNRQDGYLGVGFGISAQSMISRCPQSIATDGALVGVDLSGSDRFCLDGQRLVLATNSPAGYGEPNSVYRTEIESYQKITARGQAQGGGPLAFKVEGKDGDVRYFGNPSYFGVAFKDTDGTTLGPDSMRFANYQQQGSVALFWAQSGTVDVFGNYIAYRYRRDGSKGEHYLSAIAYGGHGNELPYQRVEFQYNNKSKPTRGYYLGALIGMNKLLRSIEVSTDGELSSRYDLSYDEAFNHLNKNRLVSIRRCVEPSSSNCSAPINFTWNRFLSTTSNFQLFAPPQSEAASTSNRHTARFFDMTGNGRSDMIYSTGSQWKLHNFENNSSVIMGSVGAAQPQYAHVINFTGQGQRDLLVSGGADSNWFVLTYELNTEEVPYCSNRDAHSVSGASIANEMLEECDTFERTTYYRSIPTGKRAIGFEGQVLIADPDGDGLEDILFTENGSLNWYRNDGGELQAKQTLLNFQSDLQLNSGISSHSTLKNSALLDFNGDGKTDLLLKVTEGRCQINGSGEHLSGVADASECREDYTNTTWETTSSWRLYVSQSGTYTERQTVSDVGESANVRAADFNGDGLTDIAYVKNNRWYVRVSNGNRLNNPIDTGVSITNSDISKTYFFDVNVDGKTDIIVPYGNQIVRFHVTEFNTAGQLSWPNRGSQSISSYEVLRIADTQGEGIPQMYSATNSAWHRYDSYISINSSSISDIYDGLGGRTQISYGRLTDKVDGEYPVYPIQSASIEVENGNFGLISPLMVVKRVQTETGDDSTVSVSYRYGGFALNRLGRGALGFEFLTSIDEQTGIETTTHYNQFFPLVGTPSSTSQFHQGELLNSSTNIYSFGVSAHSDNAMFSLLVESNDTKRERGTNGVIYKVAKSQTETDYDDYGNAIDILITQFDPDNGNTLLTTRTENSYQGDGGGAEKGRLSETTITKTRMGQVAITRKSAFIYDDRGVMFESTMAPDEPLYEVKTQLDFDRYGNQISSSVTAGINWNGSSKSTRVTTQSWGNNGRYLESKTNPVGDTVTYQYNGVSADEVQGKILTVTMNDPNDRSTITTYDVWGREIRIRPPTGGTVATYYQLCGSCNNISNAYYYIEKRQSGAPDHRTIFDKYGRVVAKSKRHFNGNWVVSKTEYDSLGRAVGNSEPGIGWPSNYKTTFTYDIHSRVKRQHTPSGALTTTSYRGRTVQVLDDNGNRKTKVVNGLGEISYVEDELGSRIYHRYDSYGNVISTQVETDSRSRFTRTFSRFDKYGRKYQTTDIDKGTWNYQYNALGELLSQTNALGQIVSFEYDNLGRKIKRIEPEGVTCWRYGNRNSNTAGLLVEEKKLATGVTSCTSANVETRKSYDYYTTGLVRRIRIKLNGSTYSIGYSYDNLGRVYQINYPDSQVKVRNEYNSSGYLRRRVDPVSNRPYMTINNMDSRGNIVSATYGNNVIENRDYKARTGFIDSILLRKGGNTLHDLSYQFDELGNLTHRSMNLSTASLNWNNGYAYDELYRLSEVTTSHGLGEQIGYAVQYDELGNITNKEGVGQYIYDSQNPYRLKQVQLESSITVIEVTPSPGDGCGPTPGPGPVLMSSFSIFSSRVVTAQPCNPSVGPYSSQSRNLSISIVPSGSETRGFTYDSNGNIRSDGIRTYQYTSYDRVKRINKGQEFSSYKYDQNRNRYYRYDKKMENGSAVYYATTYVSGLYEKIVRTGSSVSNLTEHKYYVGNIIITKRSNGSSDRFYLHNDHQGSVTTVTNQSGRVVQQFSYDAWGKRLQTFSSSILGVAISPSLNNGYTGHEQLSHLNIIHMNGRIYDPTLGRFLQADPNIQAPNNLQNYNRYSYVLNNPMSYTDPSGFFFKKLFKAIKKYWRQIAAIAISVWLPGAGGLLANAFGIGNVVVQGAITGFVAGGVATGSLKGALVGAFTGAAFGALHGWDVQGFNLGKVAAHGAVGGVSSVLQGGKFGHGFVAAGFVQGVGQVGGDSLFVDGATEIGDRVGNAVKAALIGGTASAISGGKFANGAVTGAFSRLLNDDARARLTERHRAKINNEIESEAYEKRMLIKKLVGANDVEGIRANFPELAHRDDESVLLGAQLYSSDLRRIQALAVNGNLSANMELTANTLLKSGVDALVNPNKMGLISNAIGAFNDLMGVAPPPPLRHRFVYDSYGRVDVEFIKR
ncbi:FG-GAP-like repeat-containing protein [Ferrimonas balearica]|uniref:FG-GAP-like repeat-containing protein n=1 Tax=Ferrimonas balearica TaxID=44012 RepID=UPI001C9A2875|nr:FG-GAP-like repeat-containing protein [Ferrimonas balearica]MBY5922769.1 VCBS repeat-containing protein [Ferrimonas balearica]MBY5995753.1 VCBS repeat-containing protein [Ferrimonas balearica]